MIPAPGSAPGSAPAKRACISRAVKKSNDQESNHGPMDRRLQTYKAFKRAGGSKRVIVSIGHSGAFETISDDSIACIFASIVSKSRYKENSVYAVEAAIHIHEDSVAFALTCRRIMNVFYSTATRSRTEALASASTVICPRSDCCFRFTEQVRSEERSSRQIRLLRQSNSAMCLHCAGPCCARMHKALNRDLYKAYGSDRSLHSVLETSNVVSPNEYGDVVFAYQCVKTSKRARHGEERGRRFIKQIVRAERVCTDKKTSFVITHTKEIDVDSCSAPMRMETNKSGTAVAMICSLHDIDSLAASSAFSAVSVWFAGGDVVVLDAPGGSPGPVMSPQVCAWGEANLSVAWSTDFVHPSGHTLGSNATSPDGSLCCYRFVSYAFEDGEADIDEVTSVYPGKLTSCSWTRDAREAAVIVKTTNVVTSSRHRTTFLHQIDDDKTWPISTGPLEYHALCAVISPTGDCIISFVRAKSSLKLNVSVISAHSLYTIVKGIDVTPYLMLAPNSPSTMDSEFVRATYELGFSFCGRYATILDKHAFFGTSASNQGFVIVDLSQRLDCTPLRAQPLFNTDDTAPRSIHWTAAGFYVQAPGTDEMGNVGPRGGLLHLSAA